MGEQWKPWLTLFFWAPKSLQMVIAAMKLKDTWASLVAQLVKESACNAGDLLCSIPGLGRSPGESDGTPFQYSCLGNPMDRAAWKAAVHGVAEGWTRLSDFTFTFHFHALEKEMSNPLKCSCLENPRDGGAWWAAIYGVAQSRTRLK